MKKSSIYTTLSVAGLILFNSCNAFLDTVPDNRTEINSIEKVKSLLVSAYTDRVYAGFLEPRCDGVFDHTTTMNGAMSSSYNYNQSGFMWEEYPSITSSEDAENYWASCYRAIAASNHALAALEKMGMPKEGIIYKSEALLSRAYAHFTLLTIYSNFFEETGRQTNMGIPYVVNPEVVTNGQYDRETVEATLKKVKQDIAEGLKIAGSAGDFDEPKYHFTREAGLMLDLRVALFERDYPRVITLASNFFDDVTKFAKLYDNDGNLILNEDGTETRIPHPSDPTFQDVGRKLFNWNHTSDFATGSDAVGIAFTDSDNDNVILAVEPYSLMSRYSMSNMMIRYTHSAEAFTEITGDNASGTRWDLPLYTMGSAGTASSPAFLPKCYEDFKSSNINAGTGVPYVRFSIFRLEEALLARAEAYTMTGQYDKALADLTMFSQNRAFVEDYQGEEPLEDEDLYRLGYYFYSRDKVVNFYKESLSDTEHYLFSQYNNARFETNDASSYEARLQRGLILSILDARRMEFLYEGMRWFDILRWNIPVTHTTNTGLSSTLTPEDDRRVVQIPETTSLSGLEKNPYENTNPWK